MPGFKTPCPNCKHLVPIKDAGLIGTAVSCPRCECEFVVEDRSAEREASGYEAGAGQSKTLLVAALVAVGVLAIAGVAIFLLNDKKPEHVVENPNPPAFKLTKDTLADLKAAGMPDTVLDKLIPLQDREFTSREALGQELNRVLGVEDAQEFQAAIAMVADPTYEPGTFPGTLPGKKVTDVAWKEKLTEGFEKKWNTKDATKFTDGTVTMVKERPIERVLPMPRVKERPSKPQLAAEPRLDWPRFLEVLALTLPHPGPNGNLNQNIDQIRLWRGAGDEGTAALAWFQRRMASGVRIEDTIADTLTNHPKNLAMVNVEAVNTRWVTDTGKFLAAADAHIFGMYRENIADSFKDDDRERDAATNRFKPKATDEAGWVIEIRGYTDHEAGQQFIRNAVVKNLQRFEEFSKASGGMQLPVHGRVSHAFIYKVWMVNDPRPHSFLHIDRSYLDLLVNGSHQGPMGGPGIGPGGVGGAAAEPLGPLWRGLATGAAVGSGIPGGPIGPPGGGIPIGPPGGGIPIGPPGVGGQPVGPGGVAKEQRRRYEFVVMLICREPDPETPPPDGARPQLARQAQPQLWPWFDPIAQPDTRKQNPSVLPIGDYQVDVVRGPMKGFDVVTNDRGELLVGVMPAGKLGGPGAAETKRLVEQIKKQGRAGIPVPQPKGGPPFGPPMGPGQPPGFPPGGPQRLPEPGFDFGGMRMDKSVEYIPVDELERAFERGKTPALTVVPLRMVLIHAEVPYRRQIDELQRALRLANPTEAMQFGPAYTGYEVQRKVTLPLPGGRTEVLQDWAEYKFEDKYREVIAARKLADEVDSGYLPYFTHLDMKLALPLPQLVTELGSYPAVRLRGILGGIKKLQDAARPKLAGALGGPHPGGRPPGRMNPNADIPPEVEHLLLRFVDVDVKPGVTYEYRIRLRMHNPNFQSVKDVARPADAAVETLFSPWVQLQGITLPSDAFLYAADVATYRKDIDETYRDPGDRELRNRLQVRNNQAVVELVTWLEQVRGEGANRREPVGAWVVAGVPVGRGEYIGRTQYVKLPLWSSEMREFVLREVPERFLGPRAGKAVAQPKGWLVDFSPAFGRHLLVDFEGGAVQTRDRTRSFTEEVATEMLILRPDGRLSVRNSDTDARNEDRKQLAERWAAWVKLVEARKPPDTGGGGFDRPKFDKP